MTGKGKLKITKPQVIHLLESGTVEGLIEAKKIYKKLLNYHWEYYSELARQRSVMKFKNKSIDH
jgi:hypothetical protein